MYQQTSTAQANIKDYILEQSLGTYAKPSSSYEVLLQNNTDFVIARKTAKTSRELVILISQGNFYFKDSKNGNIEEITLSKLKTYFRDLKEESITLEQVLWLPELNKYTIERLDKVITKEVFVDMCRHNVLTEIREPDWYAGYWEQNKKLFIKLHCIFPTITDKSNNKYRSSMPIIFELDKLYGYNEAMHFAETMLLSGIEKYTSALDGRYSYNNYEDYSMQGFLQLLGEPYCLNLRRLVEYIFFDAYSQGIAKIDHTFWKTYEDYLSMQLKIYGRIKEKYPRNLKTEHDIAALKVNMAEMVAKCENFEDRSAEIANLEYRGKTYCIVIPQTPQRIQCHTGQAGRKAPGIPLRPGTCFFPSYARRLYDGINPTKENRGLA